MASTSAEILPEDTLNILVATDIHLGYAELDPIRGDDSFNTFEEILSIAAQKEVDFVLLGGDLFHDNKPSPRCIHRCMSLLRRYCMGDRPVSIEFLSDQSENFQHCVNPVVNYEDPNINISIPVFSIHGNHDDPSGQGRVCSLDILSVSGLVNYFGKWNDLKAVNISPLLMKKGATHLALYGLSHIPDDRLARLFRRNNVQFFRPKEETDAWFNIFTLHQNRVNRGVNKYIEDSMLPDFLDLVVWGHEHECLIQPVWNATEDFRITQPGSPVATSLSEGEAVPKHIGILKVNRKKFQLQTIKLRTVRPYVFDSIVLSKCRIDMSKPKPTEEVQLYVADVVEDMLQRASTQISGHARQPDLPLLRLRVEYRDELQAFNTIRFGEKFLGKIANPTTLILQKKERQEIKKSDGSTLDKKAMDDVLVNENHAVMLNNRVETVVGQYFSTVDTNDKLEVLSVKGMAQAIMRFVDKDDTQAIKDIFNYQVSRTVAHLQKIDVKHEDIDKEIKKFTLQRMTKEDEEVKDTMSVLDSKDRVGKLSTNNMNFSSESSDDDLNLMNKKTLRGRARGRGQTRGSARGHVEESRDSSPPATGRGSRGSRGGRGMAPGRSSARGRSRKAPVAESIIQESFSQQMTSSRSTASRRGVILLDSDSGSDF